MPAFLLFFKAIPPKVWAFLALVIALIFGVWYVIHGYTSQIESLTKDNKALSAQVVQLKEDVSTAVAANKTNLDVITQLRNDKANAEEAKRQMAIQSKRDKKQIADIRDRIIKSPESDNGKIAPILKRTVKSIVDNRKAKEVTQ